jgi:hypothetical protein
MSRPATLPGVIFHADPGLQPHNSDLQVNRQASLCDEFGGAQSSK